MTGADLGNVTAGGRVWKAVGMLMTTGASKELCTKDVHPKGGRGGFKIVDENGHGGRRGSGRMDVHF